MKLKNVISPMALLNSGVLLLIQTEDGVKTVTGGDIVESDGV